LNPKSHTAANAVSPPVHPAAGNWQLTIERTVTGLGYDLVDVERAPRGLLRVTIDRVAGQAYPSRHAAEVDTPPDTSEFITVEDCERVTRQLQYALEVDGLDYARLEVSSPGLDRPLKRESDFSRFAGQEVAITLKLPFQGRKSWKGVLETADDGWRLVFMDGKVEQALDFRFDEVREARLVPVVDFKGRGTKHKGEAAAPAADAGVNGGLDR
jgi:ribosome maturation factor RimP